MKKAHASGLFYRWNNVEDGATLKEQIQGIRWANGAPKIGPASWPLSLQSDYRRAGARLRSRSSSGHADRMSVRFIRFSLLVLI